MFSTYRRDGRAPPRPGKGPNRVKLRDEYMRRKQAQRVAAELRNRLSRFGKERSLGNMTAAIAHEINPPLVATQNDSLAARRHLHSSPDATSKLMGVVPGPVFIAGYVRRPRNQLNGSFLGSPSNLLFEGIIDGIFCWWQ